MAGPVVTVSLPPDDNLMVHAAVEQCEPGDVLLVVPTAPSSFAMVGELLATSLAARGVAGLVVDAGEARVTFREAAPAAGIFKTLVHSARNFRVLVAGDAGGSTAAGTGTTAGWGGDTSVTGAGTVVFGAGTGGALASTGGGATG